MSLDYFKKFSSYKEEQNTNKNVWLYTRVSSKEQYDSNDSIENQELAAKEFARKNSYNITKTFGGTYESAKGDFSRKEFVRLINEVKKSKQKPFGILIFMVSRFSRSGGSAIGLVYDLIWKQNVNLIEVSSGKDTTTETGEHEIMQLLLSAKKENSDRLKTTLPGLAAFLKKGFWLGKAPRGYDHYGKRVKDIELYSRVQKLVINKEGQLLKKAWKWKLQGVPDYKILEKLNTLGLTITKQFLSEMWRKTFYCGVNTNSMLKGETVKGNWKPLVSQKNFKSINERLDGNTYSGYTQSKFCNDRPLQSHLYCGDCGSKLTGYKAKKIYDYYKCQNKACNASDMNAKTSRKTNKPGVNDQFEDYLSQFCLNRNYIEVFKAQMKLTLTDRNKESIELERSLNKQLNELESQKDKLDRKYTFEDLRSELYEKFSTEINDKIKAINAEKAKLGVSISNLDKKIDKCIKVTQNISDYWKHGSIENKIRVQKLVFPLGIVINPQNREYRTTEINSVFSLIASISSDSEEGIKEKVSISADLSSLVAGTGLEPVTFGL